MHKQSVDQLAIFDGPRLFETIISTSNLVRPDIEAFLKYSRSFYEERQYSNNGPTARLLETRLAKFHHADHCVAFANGFWAIVLTIKALAIQIVLRS